jgi:teichoic acid transport system ATP-binding protein
MVDRAGILVITSHSMHLLRDVCNKAIWIDRGIQVMSGDINAVIDSYLASSTLTAIAAE